MSLRQQIGRVAGLLSTGGAGDITGVVFRDDEGIGRYRLGMATLSGYEVVLDGQQRISTAGDGAYLFRRVPAGRHRVEVRLPGESLYFTTPSPADVAGGQSADFGVASIRSRLRVRVASDAAIPLAGVVLRATSGAVERTVTTGPDGVGPFDGLDEGTYDVRLDAASLPAGYYLVDTEPRRATVAPALSSLIDLVIRAARSIAGRIRMFNTQTGTYMPAPSAAVELRPSGHQTLTDMEGQYVFRDLPSGEHIVVVRGAGRATTMTVTAAARARHAHGHRPGAGAGADAVAGSGVGAWGAWVLGVRGCLGCVGAWAWVLRARRCVGA